MGNYAVVSIKRVLCWSAVVHLAVACGDPATSPPMEAEGTADASIKDDAKRPSDTVKSPAASPCDKVECGPTGLCVLTIQNDPICLCGTSYSHGGVECATECTRTTGMIEIAARTHRATFHATYDGEPVAPRSDGKRVQIRLTGTENYRQFPSSFVLEDGVPIDLPDGVYNVSWTGAVEIGSSEIGPSEYDKATWHRRQYGYLRVRGDVDFSVDFPRLVHVKGKIEVPNSWSRPRLTLSSPEGELTLTPEDRTSKLTPNFNEADGSFEAYLPAGAYDLLIQNSIDGGPVNGPSVRNAIVVKPGTPQVDVKLRIPVIKVTVNAKLDGIALRCDSDCGMLRLSSSSLMVFPRQVSPGRFEYFVPPGEYSVEFAPVRTRIPFAGTGIIDLGTISVPTTTEINYDLRYLKLAGEVRVDGIPAGQSFDFQFTTYGGPYRVDNAADRTFTSYVLAGYPVTFELRFMNGTKGRYPLEPRVFNDDDNKVTLDLAKVNANVSVAVAPSNLTWPTASTQDFPFGLTIVPTSKHPLETPAFGFPMPSPFVSVNPTGEYWIGYTFGRFGWFSLDKITLDTKTPTYSGVMNMVDVKARVTIDGIPLVTDSPNQSNVVLVRKGMSQSVSLTTSATGEFQVPVPAGDYYAFVKGRGMVSCITIGAPQ
jgi:hypothetical protein